jgi:hypothetical protein
LGDEREHLIVVALIASGPVTRLFLSLDLKVVSSVRQEMDVPGAEVSSDDEPRDP